MLTDFNGLLHGKSPFREYFCCVVMSRALRYIKADRYRGVRHI